MSLPVCLSTSSPSHHPDPLSPCVSAYVTVLCSSCKVQRKEGKTERRGDSPKGAGLGLEPRARTSPHSHSALQARTRCVHGQLPPRGAQMELCPQWA